MQSGGGPDVGADDIAVLHEADRAVVRLARLLVDVDGDAPCCARGVDERERGRADALGEHTPAPGTTGLMSRRYSSMSFCAMSARINVLLSWI